MTDWKLVFLPSYEADLERYQIDQEKLDKWFEDLKKKPDYINNAHALVATWRPFWSAHFNERTNYIVLYLLCNGNETQCFKARGIEKFSFLDLKLIEHTCTKAEKRIFVCRFGNHKLYKE